MVSLQMKPELVNRIDALASEMDVSRSVLMRLAIARGLTIMEMEWKQTHGRFESSPSPEWRDR